MAPTISARLSTAEGRRFGLELGLGLLALAALARWRGRPGTALVLGGVGTALALTAIVAPFALGPVRRVWMGLADAISRVTTPIVLGLLYFVVFLLLGWALRLAGRRPLTEGRTNESAWVPRRLRSDLRRQF